MSQDELSERSGLARPTISKIERGETEPSGLSRQKIADALSISATELFADSEDTSVGSLSFPSISGIMGIAVVNGTMAAAGVRGVTRGEVTVKEARIEGFLIDRTGEKIPNTMVHLIKDGEKIDTTVSGRSGRFVFKDLEEGEYILLAEDKYQPISVNYTNDKFEFDV